MKTTECDIPALGKRLLMARKAKGWSCRTVVKQLVPLANISHATVANYEKSVTQPPIDVLSAMAAIYERPVNWFLGSGPLLTGVRYRNLKSKVGVRARHRFEGQAQKWIDAYVAIEEHLGEMLTPELQFERRSKETPSHMAARLREQLRLKDGEPVASVVDILEQLGVRVIAIETDLAIDGMAALLGERTIVVLNDAVSPDRARMNAGHELGHILRGDCHIGGEETKEQESAAFQFSSHLLLTPEMLCKAFSRKSVVDLVHFKQRFGISLAAMVYRAGEAGLISETEKKRLWFEFSRRGWRTKEPGYVHPDRPARFEALVSSAMIAHDLPIESLASTTGVRPDELRRRIDAAIGMEEKPRPRKEVPTTENRLRLVH